MTEQPAPLTNRNLDSQLLRRTALKLHTAADELVSGIHRDALGQVSAIQARQLFEDGVADLVEVLKDLLTLQRLASHAADSEIKWSQTQ